MKPAFRPVAELTASLADGSLTSAALTDDCLQRIEAHNARWNAVISVDADGARAAARVADDRRAAGQSLGPLDGLPLLVKDNIHVAGLATTCGSKILGDFVSPTDSTVVERAKAAGTVILGKANLDEFAMGSTNEHSAFGLVRNPHDEERVPGGSSGGSCAAVAGGFAPLALGSDTGGSVRLPASYCGVVGLKPTWGRVSRSGLVAFGSSLDQVGPVARTVDGCAALLQALAGVDPRDATSAPVRVPDYSAELSRGIEGLRVGVRRDLLGDGVDVGVRTATERALELLAAAGAELVDVELPNARYGVAAYYIVASAEASSNLARFDGARYGRRADAAGDLETLYVESRTEGFGEEVKRRILIGTFALSAGYQDRYYGRAQRARALIRRDYAEAFAKADVIASPVAPAAAFRLGECDDDPLKMYLMDAMTIPANLAGVPAISVPVGAADGLPVGLQLAAPHFEEARLFRVGAEVERRCGVAAAPAAVAEEATE